MLARLTAVSILLLLCAAPALGRDAPPRTVPAAPADPATAAPEAACLAPRVACAMDWDDPCLEGQAFSDPPEAVFDRQAHRAKRHGDPCVLRLSEIRVCLAEWVTTCGPGAEILPSDTGRSFLLRGTRWIGDRGEDRIDLVFDQNGVVDYITPSGHWRTGRYARHHGEIVISMNNGFAIYFGAVGVSKLEGFFVNVRDERSLWTLARSGEPRALAAE